MFLMLHKPHSCPALQVQSQILKSENWRQLKVNNTSCCTWLRAFIKVLDIVVFRSSLIVLFSHINLYGKKCGSDIAEYEVQFYMINPKDDILHYNWTYILLIILQYISTCSVTQCGCFITNLKTSLLKFPIFSFPSVVTVLSVVCKWLYLNFHHFL